MLQANPIRYTPKRENHFNSYTIRVIVPEGRMFVAITEDHNSDPRWIKAFAGKTGTTFQAWADGMCELIEELLKNRVPMARIINMLSKPSTANYRTQDVEDYNGNGVKIYSGPQGFHYALLRYLQLKADERRQAVS